MLRFVCLLLLVPFAGCFGGDPSSAEPEPLGAFVVVGSDCMEVIALRDADADALELPAPFRTQGPRATVGVGLLRCQAYGLENGTLQQGGQAELGVVIESPDTRSGSHYYELAIMSDHPEVAAAYEARGFRGGSIPAIQSVTDVIPGLGGSAMMAADWSEGPFAVTAQGLGPASIPWDDSYWWHVGDGTWRITYSLTNVTLMAARTTLEAQAQAHDWVGSGDGPGLMATFDLRAVVEPV